MTHLDQLESQSVYILREAFNRIDKLVMLWSIGKDSNVIIWLARRTTFQERRAVTTLAPHGGAIVRRCVVVFVRFYGALA